MINEKKLSEKATKVFRELTGDQSLEVKIKNVAEEVFRTIPTGKEVCETTLLLLK